MKIIRLRTTKTTVDALCRRRKTASLPPLQKNAVLALQSLPLPLRRLSHSLRNQPRTPFPLFPSSLLSPPDFDVSPPPKMDRVHFLFSSSLFSLSVSTDDNLLPLFLSPAAEGGGGEMSNVLGDIVLLLLLLHRRRRPLLQCWVVQAGTVFSTLTSLRRKGSFKSLMITLMA